MADYAKVKELIEKVKAQGAKSFNLTIWNMYSCEYMTLLLKRDGYKVKFVSRDLVDNNKINISWD